MLNLVSLYLVQFKSKTTTQIATLMTSTGLKFYETIQGERNISHKHTRHTLQLNLASTGDSFVNLAHARLVAQFKRDFKVELCLQHYSKGRDMLKFISGTLVTQSCFLPL